MLIQLKNITNACIFNNNATASTPTPETVYFDNIDDLIDLSLVQEVFSPHLLNSDYTGSTALIKRTSDDAEQGFSVGDDGYLDDDAIDTWRAGSATTCTGLYGQVSSNFLTFTAGVPYCDADGVRSKFAKEWDSSTGQLTGTAQGMTGIATTSNQYGYINTTDFTTTSGIEFHFLMQSTLRLKPANQTDPLGTADATRQDVFCYGPDNLDFLTTQLTGGNFSHYLRRYYKPAGTAYDDSTSTGTKFQKANSQMIYSFVMPTDNMYMYGEGEKLLTKALNANTVTHNGDGGFNGKKFIYGARVGASGAVTSTSCLKATLGAIVVTKTLTDLQRYTLRAKLNAMAQSHRLQTLDTIKGYFDEIINFNDFDTDTKQVTGINSKVTLQFNENLTWNKTVVPDFGIPAVQFASDTDSNTNYIATSTYFSDVITGSIGHLAFRDSTGNSAGYATNLGTWCGMVTDNTGATPSTAGMSWSTGFGHNSPQMLTRMSYDPNGKHGNRKYLNGDTFSYDLANQPLGKYNIMLATTIFIYDEDLAGKILTEAVWQNELGVVKNTPDNVGFPKNRGYLSLQIGTFQAPEGYSRSLTQTAKDALCLQATNKLYATYAGKPIGHLDSSIAIQDGWGAVVDSADTAKLGNFPYLTYAKGYLSLLFFAKSVLTQTQIEEVQVNFYKLFV